MCDAKWDCPYGEDEHDCTVNCSGLFWCPVEQICLSFVDLCDGRIHCEATQSDEMFCDVNLANCNGAICPDHHKCANYYCVPMRYTCDGKQDCPMGDDEHGCFNRSCTGLFRCRNSNICLQSIDVENGKIDCIEGDDELFDGISVCPTNCSCLMNSYSCILPPTMLISVRLFL